MNLVMVQIEVNYLNIYLCGFAKRCPQTLRWSAGILGGRSAQQGGEPLDRGHPPASAQAASACHVPVLGPVGWSGEWYM